MNGYYNTKVLYVEIQYFIIHRTAHTKINGIVYPFADNMLARGCTEGAQHPLVSIQLGH